MEAPKQAIWLILVEVLERFGGGIVARICCSWVNSGAIATRLRIHTLLRSAAQDAWKRRMGAPYGFHTVVVLTSLKAHQAVSMLCLRGVDILHLVL